MRLQLWSVQTLHAAVCKTLRFGLTWGAQERFWRWSVLQALHACGVQDPEGVGSRGTQERFRRWSVAQTARAEEERAASAFLAAQRQPSADPLAQRLRSVALREDSESGSELGADLAADAESGALRCPLNTACLEAFR